MTASCIDQLSSMHRNSAPRASCSPWRSSESSRRRERTTWGIWTCSRSSISTGQSIYNQRLWEVWARQMFIWEEQINSQMNSSKIWVTQLKRWDAVTWVLRNSSRSSRTTMCRWRTICPCWCAGSTPVIARSHITSSVARFSKTTRTQMMQSILLGARHCSHTSLLNAPTHLTSEWTDGMKTGQKTLWRPVVESLASRHTKV